MVNTRFSTYIRPGLLDGLPVDLKRDILETTAYLYPLFAPRLALVSREVQTWAERIIYRELFFNGQRLYHRTDKDALTTLQKFNLALEARPAGFFAEYVKSLHFDGNFTPEQILPIIQVCTGVTNLGLYATLNGDGLADIYRLADKRPLHTLFISTKNLTALLQAESAPSGSSLRKLTHLALVDGWEHPAPRFPALTHLALVPDFDDKAVLHVNAALANAHIQSVVVMLNYIDTSRQAATLRTLKEITDPRLVLFTLPVSATKYIEDDLWDLAMEFPDEEQPIAYLTEIPGPRILSFQEVMELGL